MKSSIANSSSPRKSRCDTEYSLGTKNTGDNKTHSKLDMPVVTQQETTDSNPQLSSIEMKSDHANV